MTEPIDPHQWAQRFAMLADPTRLALLIAMHSEPGLSVVELAAAADVTQNAASQALRSLREHGWVAGDRAGRSVQYRLNNDAIVHRILHDIIGAHHHKNRR